MEAIVRKNPKMWMLTIYLFAVSAFLHVRPSVAFDQDGNPPPIWNGKPKGDCIPGMAVDVRVGGSILPKCGVLSGLFAIAKC